MELGALPRSPSLPPVPPHRLTQPSVPKLPQDTWRSCSEDEHLLAHPGVPQGTRMQTGIPAQGAHNLNKTRHTHTGHRHGERGIFTGNRWSEKPRAGASACSSLVFLVVFAGGGRGTQDVTQDGLPESSSIGGDSQEKENTRGRWSQVQGEVGEHLRSGVDEDRPREVKTEEGKKSREGPEPAARDCHRCWAWAVSDFRLRFPGLLSQREPEQKLWPRAPLRLLT